MAGEEFNAAMGRAFGKTLSDDQVKELDRIQRAFRIADNDAVWAVYAITAVLRDEFKELPAKVEKEVTQVLEAARDTAERGAKAEQVRAKTLMAAEAQKAQTTLVEQVAESARAIAGQRTRQAMLRAARWTAVAVALVAGAAAWAGWRAGQSTGYEAGRASVLADQDPQAVEWAQSYWGRQAQALHAKGLLPWAVSPEASMLSDLAERGLVADLWADLDGAEPDMVFARRADVEWLASEAGQQARALSEAGTIDWLASEEGGLALTLRASGALAETLTAGGVGGPDLAVVARTEAEWLRSADGQQALAWSRDGTLAWVGSEAAVWARSGTGASWISWTRTLLASGLLFEDGLPGEQACEGVAEKGYGWRLTNGGGFCEVWQGRVFFAMGR